MGNAAATPALGAAPSKTPTIKLLIAKEAQVVVLAEAGKDVVDFLFGLLAMPVGAVVKLLAKESPLAGLASIYASVQRINPLPAHPSLVDAAGGFPSLVQPAAPPAPGMSLKKGLQQAIPHLNIGSACHCASCLAAQAQGATGFVRGLVTYTVMDDLSVTPMSNISGIALLNKLGVEDLGALEERTGLEILKASLKSSTVLTDVFLAKKKRARTTNDKTGACQQQQDKRARVDDTETGKELTT
ncbi:hypothetical protein PR202_ga23426 [Eleusine coracana subsp. coracana]|uniref:Uncharacterized protein n=1 Tax=Eleusine coracana subsp. coracana TaxID=191504 RepID=A0AAV5D564_ELECO|nr:hypothetical protein PR202_ga23426 [Eleusine coracana subsp. coracana]